MNEDTRFCVVFTEEPETYVRVYHTDWEAQQEARRLTFEQYGKPTHYTYSVREGIKCAKTKRVIFSKENGAY
jgi:hypothetical protein